MVNMIKIIKKSSHAVINRECRWLILDSMGLFNCMPDEKFLKCKYQAIMNTELNVETPQTFNEKLQWLKLYDRSPEYTTMVDKYAVREYIADKIGDEYLIPLLGVWEAPDDIDFDALPNQFVLKCNHNSGLGMCICKDKSKLDIKQVRKNLNKGLKQDYYLTGREWPYKKVSRKIIAEKYMVDESGTDLKDYKIFCFNGIPKLILVCSERFSTSGLREDFFDVKWNHLNIIRPKHPNLQRIIEMPALLKELLEIARILSQKTPFLRADLYVINNRIYFGELTFFPAAGFETFIPEEWNYTLGSWLKLPIKE